MVCNDCLLNEVKMYPRIEGPNKNITTGEMIPKRPTMDKLCASWSR